MKKYLLFVLLICVENSWAFGFQGCGEYNVKGVLRKKKEGHLGLVYIVNEGTKSQMSFSLKEKKDLFALMPLLDHPSQFKAEIASAMDGTKGFLKEVREISRRMPKPLEPAEDTGISLLLAKKCQ